MDIGVLSLLISAKRSVKSGRILKPNEEQCLGRIRPAFRKRINTTGTIRGTGRLLHCGFPRRSKAVNIFYIIGVVVVIVAVLGFFGLR